TTLAANARGSSKAAESLLAQFSLPIDTANTVPQLSVNSSSGYADVRLNQAASSSDSSSCHVVMTVASLPSLDMPLAYSRSMMSCTRSHSGPQQQKYTHPASSKRRA